MNILYTCDNNYIWLMGISTISLFENNKDIETLTVYLLGENISNENKRIIKKIEKKYSRQIIVIDVPKLDIPESLISGRWPLSAFTRLFSGQLLPESVHRVLYLDCDTIIKGCIEVLDTIELGLHVCGGIKDCIGKTYKENIGLDGNDAYINAGVILLNIDELRKIDVKKSIDSYMNRFLKLINYADQDILNGMFKGKIKILPPQFDVMTITTVYSYEEIVRLRRPTNYYNKKDIEAAVASPVIIHYTTNMRIVRPWFSNSDHPLSAEFRKYMRISPWKDKQLGEMVFTSKEEKIIQIIHKLPKQVAQVFLGFIHSELKPRYIKLKS